MSNIAHAAAQTGAPSAVLRVGPALEAKIGTDSSYREFVGAVESACASEEARLSGAAGYELDEKPDRENFKWIKLTLRVSFVDGDFKSKWARQKRLRRIVDEQVRRTRLASGDPGRMDEIGARFFIATRW